MSELVSLDAVLEAHIPEDKLAEVKRILYGNPTEYAGLAARVAKLFFAI